MAVGRGDDIAHRKACPAARRVRVDRRHEHSGLCAEVGREVADERLKRDARQSGTAIEGPEPFGQILQLREIGQGNSVRPPVPPGTDFGGHRERDPPSLAHDDEADRLAGGGFAHQPDQLPRTS